MRLGTITRGDQKIYVALEATCPEDGRIVAKSYCSDNAEVAALVIDREGAQDEYVLVLPLLQATQEVRIRSISSDGTVVEELRHKFPHLSSAVEAKYNTLRKKPDIYSIRNYDRDLRKSSSVVFVEMVRHIGYEADDSELVRVNIKAFCPSRAAADVPVHIRIFDRKGHASPVKDQVVLSDDVNPVTQGSDVLRREMKVSFQKNYDVDEYFVWVQFEDGSSPSALTFVDKQTSETLREGSENEISHTGQCGRYQEWFYLTQKASSLEIEAQRDVSFEIEPLFSVIVPLYKTPLDFFEDMAQSVLKQSYSKLELILVNSTPEDEALSAAAQACADADDRVRVVTLDKNYGIALNTNEGIKVAKGDFLSFFDHDDVLELNLFHEYVKGLNKYPETDLFYCDEDKLGPGFYFDGFLKPDFSWEYLMTCNYICHLLTVRKSIVDTVELSGDDVAGAQDWDMTMKVAEKARNVFHCRRILYHWRAHEKSAAMNAGSKPYTHHAGEIAIQNHFERVGLKALIHDGDADNVHRIEYILPEDAPLVSIIIPNKDQSAMLEHCLDSIWNKSTYGNYEIIIVENNSTEDETFALYERLEKEHDNVSVITYEGGFNFSAICNAGAKVAKGDALLFLNNDMEVISPNWLESLLGPLQREETSIVGARLLYANGTIQHDGVVLPKTMPAHVSSQLAADCSYYFGITQRARDVLAVTGACLMIKRADFESIDGFDEEYAVAYNDVDLCLRLVEKGKHVIMNPYARLYHFESMSRGFDVTNEKRLRLAREAARFQERWTKYLVEGDPYYGTNLACGTLYYGLDWTIRH